MNVRAFKSRPVKVLALTKVGWLVMIAPFVYNGFTGRFDADPWLHFALAAFVVVIGAGLWGFGYGVLWEMDRSSNASLGDVDE